MRARFAEPFGEEALERERASVCAREAWASVAEGEDQYAVDLIARVDDRLALRVEREAEQDVAHLELSALEPSAWPLAELLLSLVPPELDVTSSLGRHAVSLEIALAEVEEEHGVGLARASLRAGFTRGHLLEITLGIPGGTGAEIEQNAAENLVRAVLGDRLFETWVGAVQVSAEPRVGSLRVLDVRAPRSKLQIQELFETVAAAARGVLIGLSEQAYAERGDVSSAEEWTMLEVEPFADAPGGRKEDLLLASTCTPELLRCFLDGAPCSSRRFSRAGESFVFVSYADAGASMQERLARRSEIEVALHAGLVGLGAVTGVGLGVHSTYVDVALRDLETGLERLIATLREQGVPEDTLVQFFDSELSEEWLSIWPESQLLVG